MNPKGAGKLVAILLMHALLILAGHADKALALSDAEYDKMVRKVPRGYSTDMSIQRRLQELEKILPPEERKKLREQHRKWRTQVIEDDARLFMQAGKSWNNAHILAMDRQYHFLTIAQQQFVEGKADWLAVSEKDLVDASHGRVQLPDDPLAELLLRDAALEEEFVRRRIWYDAADDYYSEARPSFFARSTTSMLAAWLSEKGYDCTFQIEASKAGEVYDGTTQFFLSCSRPNSPALPFLQDTLRLRERWLVFQFSMRDTQISAHLEAVYENGRALPVRKRDDFVVGLIEDLDEDRDRLRKASVPAAPVLPPWNVPGIELCGPVVTVQDITPRVKRVWMQNQYGGEPLGAFYCVRPSSATQLDFASCARLAKPGTPLCVRVHHLLWNGGRLFPAGITDEEVRIIHSCRTPAVSAKEPAGGRP